ncbi:hypothetical protein SmJEL517_g00852 [Synchytrium microbalum]|uniref:Uncharacterized protein n=1 Tax=Synchytrium microbalum TaxID=1806994 RepID=A0A507CGQ0_9FUNG|nr:uncharacterized protein SmJEL517_g00852 [Synchytrium microbalum]TPX37226.1 hypothetical protein SmJEL517_g00852 [Synchytrium microbalum]
MSNNEDEDDFYDDEDDDLEDDDDDEGLDDEARATLTSRHPWTNTLVNALNSSNTTTQASHTTAAITAAVTTTSSTGSTLPKLVSRKRKGKNSAIMKCLNAATRTTFIERQRESLLTNDDFDLLWDSLNDRASGLSEDERSISYIDFQNTRLNLPDKFNNFFKASVYLRFTTDEMGNISVQQFFNYVLRKVSLLQARIDLSAYDGDFDGYLTEDELQKYISDLMPTLNLHAITKSFKKYYLATASRKFVFFLDPQRRNKISIQSILLSPILTELFELREPNLPKDLEKTNWFSGVSTHRVYMQYLHLDQDHNGMLSRKEVSRYSQGTFSSSFLDRLFEECQTYHGELDFVSWLDFVLAIENIGSPEAVTYCFRLLDVENRGYLNQVDIQRLLVSVVDRMESFGHEAPKISDLTNEIFDMANPAQVDIITLNDLLDCGVAGTVFNLLADAKGFFQYENREALAAQGGGPMPFQ